LNVTGNSNLLGNVIIGIANLGNTYIGGTTPVNVIGSTTTVLGVVNPLTLVDGSVLLSNTPPLDFSNNYGTVWTPTATSQNWQGVAMSASGQYQTAVINRWIHVYFQQLRCDVDIHRHNSDIGTAVAMSASGQYQTAVVYGGASGFIYISSNYGVTWTSTATSQSSNLARSSGVGVRTISNGGGEQWIPCIFPAITV
jgi:hypothetical protein